MKYSAVNAYVKSTSTITETTYSSSYYTIKTVDTSNYLYSVPSGCVAKITYLKVVGGQIGTSAGASGSSNSNFSANITISKSDGSSVIMFSSTSNIYYSSGNSISLTNGAPMGDLSIYLNSGDTLNLVVNGTTLGSNFSNASEYIVYTQPTAYISMILESED